VVTFLGSRYAFSQRLISLMIYATEINKRAAQQLGKDKKTTPAVSPTAATTAAAPSAATTSPNTDPEKAIPSSSSASTRADKSLPVLGGEEIELYFLLKDTVNFSSIDRTSRGKFP
jgi:hypothetical protein